MATGKKVTEEVDNFPDIIEFIRSKVLGAHVFDTLEYRYSEIGWFLLVALDKEDKEKD